MYNWKAAGPDHVQGFWFKKATTQTSTGVCEYWTSASPMWMTVGRTILIMKDKKLQTNFSPSTVWKLLTSIFSEAIYGHLSRQELLPNEQKRCRKTSRGTKDQLLIDKAILKNC